MALPATNLKWRSDSLGEQYVTVLSGGQLPVDYVGIAAHNFGTGLVAVELQGQQDDGDEYETIAQEFTPSTDRPILIRMPRSSDAYTEEDDGFVTESVSVSYDAGSIISDVTEIDDLGDISITYYRIRLKLTPASTKPQVGVLYAGELLQIERGIYVGHTPITFSRSVSITVGKSQSGQYLGQVVGATIYETQVKLSYLTPSWCRGDFEGFIAAATVRPFFFAWRADERPEEIGYCWLSDGVPVPENSGPRDLMSVSFKIGGLA